MGEWISGTTWKHVYFNISVLFIVNTTFILKLVFPTSYCFCLDDRLGGYVVATIVPVFIVAFTYLFIYLVYLFIYLLYFLPLRPLFLSLLSLLSSLLLLLLLVLSLPFVCVCVVIVIAKLMLMFSILVLLCVPYFALNILL